LNEDRWKGLNKFGNAELHKKLLGSVDVIEKGVMKLRDRSIAKVTWEMQPEISNTGGT
jgi:hypothetical protein